MTNKRKLANNKLNKIKNIEPQIQKLWNKKINKTIYKMKNNLIKRKISKVKTTKSLIKMIGIKANKTFHLKIIRKILNHIQIIALKHQRHKNNNIKKAYNFTIQ